MSVGIYSYTFPFFVRPMVEELGTSRSLMMLAFTLSNLLRGWTSLFLGGVIDRGSGRTLVVMGAIITGFGLIGLSRVQTYWQFLILWSGVFMLGTVLAGSLVLNVAVSNWFVRKRGKAQGLATMGVSFGGVVLPHIVAPIIAGVGWRTAWVFLGVLVWVILVAPAALLLKRRPEDAGLLPDGERRDPIGAEKRPVHAASATAPTVDVRWTRREAMRTPTLWLITLAFGLAGMGLWMVTSNVVAYLQDAGHSVTWAATAFSLMAFAAFGAKPFWGILTDRFPTRYVIMVNFVVSAVGIVSLTLASRQPLAIYAALALVGLGYGGQTVLAEVMWANSFGRVSLATVRTTAMPFSTVISSLSPVMGGIAYDRLGSYTLAFLLMAGGWVLAAFLILFTRRPQKQATEPVVIDL